MSIPGRRRIGWWNKTMEQIAECRPEWARPKEAAC